LKSETGGVPSQGDFCCTDEIRKLYLDIANVSTEA
jgi:hypothetical protein